VTQVFAHRGYHATARENTVAAFRAAVALGVDGVELDVRWTRDGSLVVHHDARLGARAIAELERGALPEHVATLAEALAACRGLRVNVEIKNLRHWSEPTYDATGRLAALVVEEVRSAHATDSVIFSCFDFETCEVVRSLAASLRVGWLVERRFDTARALRLALDAGLDALHPNFRSVDEATVAKARDHGLALYVWTPNKSRDLAALAAWGVDGIITDEPVTALAVTR
jgi:glycerophosphoryl diester phosphodiesterase